MTRPLPIPAPLTTPRDLCGTSVSTDSTGLPPARLPKGNSTIAPCTDKLEETSTTSLPVIGQVTEAPEATDRADQHTSAIEVIAAIPPSPSQGASQNTHGALQESEILRKKLAALEQHVREMEVKGKVLQQEKEVAIEEVRQASDKAKNDAIKKARQQMRKENEAARLLDRRAEGLERQPKIARTSELAQNADIDKNHASLVGTPLGERRDGLVHIADRNDHHRQQLEASGVVFDSDSDSDSLPEVPPPKSRPLRRDALWQRPKQSLDLFEVAPQYHQDRRFFDAEAKKAEIRSRPRRKATFGKVLAASRPERGDYVHHEIHRGMSPTLVKVPQDDDEEDEENDDETRHEDASGERMSGPGQVRGERLLQMPLKDFWGLPDNPIATLATDGQLAYRDGTRNAAGKLSRAKQIFKVGRIMNYGE